MTYGEASKQFTRRMMALAETGKMITLKMDTASVSCVISGLQLALRHPGNRGHASKTMRKVVDKLIQQFDQLDPELAKLLRLGDDPGHDVGVNPFTPEPRTGGGGGSYDPSAGGSTPGTGS